MACRERIIIQGFGDTRPPGADRPGMREPQNRRVEIIIRLTAPGFSAIHRDAAKLLFSGLCRHPRCSPNFFTEDGEVGFFPAAAGREPVSLIISNNEGRSGLSFGYFREPLPLCGTFIA